MNGAGIKQGAARTGSTTYLRQQRLIAWHRDQGTCVWCGRRPHLNRCTPKGCELCFEVDHVRHVSNGGTDHHTNLVVACRACNQSRSTHAQPRNITLKPEPSGPMVGVRRAW